MGCSQSLNSLHHHNSKYNSDNVPARLPACRQDGNRSMPCKPHYLPCIGSIASSKDEQHTVVHVSRTTVIMIIVVIIIIIITVIIIIIIIIIIITTIIIVIIINRYDRGLAVAFTTEQ